MTRFLLLAGVLVFAGCSSSSPYYGRDGRSSGRYGQYGSRSYPTWSKTSSGGQDRYVVCHRRNTLTLPTAAVDAHLRHGDRFGACGVRVGRDGRPYDAQGRPYHAGRTHDDHRDQRGRADRDDRDQRGRSGERGRGRGRR